MLSRGMIAIAIVTGIESRVADRGGSRVLASNRPCRQGFSAATGCYEWVSVERGRWRMTRSNGRARGGGKGLKRKMVEQRGERTFIDVESGGWPVHAPCPKQRVAKPGGANRSTEIIKINFIFLIILY
jgi:hypothetical protein